MEDHDAEVTRETDDLLAAARMSRDATSKVVLAMLRRRLFDASELPTVGRYQLEREIGAGGMGVVYAARDPELNRRVAIKLIRPRASVAQDESSARAMLLREARSMAALSHPNVLPIYDVGTEAGTVFLAMELVEGVTLRQWLAGGPRSMAEVLATFVAAARGLAAAHAAGLVHRDFKPSNVLVANNGRVFVMDFGLARSVDGTSLGRSITRDSGRRGSDDSITQTGFAVGSPAYMSPQQHRGEAPDPKADQWSFCVALYEAVYRRLPFAADSLDGMRMAVDLGLGPLPKGDVPAHVRRVIRTGLRPHPASRFANMKALLAVLQPGGRRRVGTWVAGAVVVAGAAAGLAMAQPSAASTCEDALTEGRAIWTVARRDALIEHAGASEPAWPHEVVRRTVAAVDRYHAQWLEAQSHVCGSADSRDESVLASARLRSACLRRRLSGLAESLMVLGELDGREAARAPSTIARLPPVADCAAVDRLEDAHRPGDPSDSPEADAVVRALQRAQALRSVGQFSVGLTAAQDALESARALGATRLEVRIGKLIGSLYGDLGRFEESAAILEEAVFTAEAAHLDGDAARAAIVALFTAARAAKPEEAERWAGFAKAKLDSVAHDEDLRAELLLRLSDAADMRGDYAEAERFALEAESVAAPVRTPYAYASTLHAVARAHGRAGRIEEAEATHTRALRLVERSVGPQHPEALKIRGNIAVARLNAGKHASARDELEATLPDLALVFGERSQPVALALGNLASAYRGLGDPERALELHREALAVRREVLGDGQRVALTLYNIAAQLAELHRYDESIAAYQESIELWSAASGQTHPMLLHPLEGLAETFIITERYEDAKVQLQRAAKVHEANETPPARRVLWTFYSGQVAMGLGDAGEGLRLAKEARAMMQRAEAPAHRVETITTAIDEWLAAHPTDEG